MPSASQFYNTGRWLNATDLLPLNQRRTAIINNSEPEMIGAPGGDQKTMLMLTLVSRQGQAWPKKLPLNKSNMMQIVAAFGDDYSTWTGKQVEVWSENVLFQGKMVPGIKVQPASNGSGSGITYAPQQGQPQTQAQAPATPSPSATAVTGMPPATGPNWTPPNTRTTQLEDDEIPF